MRRKNWLAWVLAAVVLIVAIAMFWPHQSAAPTHRPVPTATPQPPASPAPTQQSEPQPSFSKGGQSRLPAPSQAADPLTLVHAYFTDLTSGNYQQAYGYFSPSLQQAESYTNFVAAFAGGHVSYNASSIQIIGSGNYSQIYQVPYTVTRSSGSTTYTATLRCVDRSGGVGTPDWTIESWSVTQTGA